MGDVDLKWAKHYLDRTDLISAFAIKNQHTFFVLNKH
jgi:hypothetical protein